MEYNKVIYDGKVLIDLTEVTVTEDTLAEGITAYNAAGELIHGTAQISTEWVYVEGEALVFLSQASADGEVLTITGKATVEDETIIF